MSRGSLRSDIKKLPGTRTVFRTPAGVAAVKGTVVDCIVGDDEKVELQADFGLLTHEISEKETSVDLSGGKRIKVSVSDKGVEARSLVGNVELKTRKVSTRLYEDSQIVTDIDRMSESVVLEVKNGDVKSKTKVGAFVVMDKGDKLKFSETGSGVALTVVSGEVMVHGVDGTAVKLGIGETTVVSTGNWLEPETPEGPEVMVPPDA